MVRGLSPSRKRGCSPRGLLVRKRSPVWEGRSGRCRSRTRSSPPRVGGALHRSRGSDRSAGRRCRASTRGFWSRKEGQVSTASNTVTICPVRSVARAVSRSLLAWAETDAVPPTRSDPPEKSQPWPLAPTRVLAGAPQTRPSNPSSLRSPGAGGQQQIKPDKHRQRSPHAPSVGRRAFGCSLAVSLPIGPRALRSSLCPKRSRSRRAGPTERATERAPPAGVLGRPWSANLEYPSGVGTVTEI